jgi:hypothetical protein
VILIRHGQTEFNRVFSVTRQDPGVRDRHGRKSEWSLIGAFIRAMTGLKVPNGAVLRINPTRSDREPELLFVPEAG